MAPSAADAHPRALSVECLNCALALRKTAMKKYCPLVVWLVIIAR